MMKKAMNNETRSKKAINMINTQGATWEDVGAFLGLQPKTIQKIVKDHYKSDTCYARLLKKARANKLAKAEAAKLISDGELTSSDDSYVVEAEDVKEVIVTETGYLLDVGVSGLLSESLDVYLPFFCIEELEKLGRGYAAANELLTMYWSTRRVTSINLRGKEVLYEDPVVPVKARSRGVVAVCVELDSLGYKVRLLTNSREIEDLAKLQGCDISVVRVKKAR